MKKRKMLLILFFAVILIVGGFLAGFAIVFQFAETPIFNLPIANIADVTGIQVFHDNRSTQLHTGFDFKLENDTEIFAPISGTITSVKKHRMSNDYWLIDVNIRINAKWGMFIAFEPWTTDEAIIDEQMVYITVSIGDRVEIGESIGFLKPATEAEFPHIHWNVNYKTFYGIRVDVSPFDYCSSVAKSLIFELCDKFDKLPEDAL